MKKMTKEQLDATVRLLNEDSFMSFVNWIEQSRVEEMEIGLNMAVEPQRSWVQGGAKELGRILSAIKEAKSNLEAIERGGRDE